MNLQDYLDNPCKKLSIPYWKNKHMDLPKNIVVLHKDNFFKSNRKFIKADNFFRIIHKLSSKSFSSNPERLYKSCGFEGVMIFGIYVMFLKNR